MKPKIVNVSRDITGALNTIGKQQEAHIDENSAQMINDVMKVMMSVKPAWRTSFKTEDEINGYKKELCHALIKDNISFEQINSALDRVRKCPSPFMPSVGQFIEWTAKNKIKHPSHRIFDTSKLIENFTEEARQKNGKRVVSDIRSAIAKIRESS